jgi:hypothetical protein
MDIKAILVVCALICFLLKAFAVPTGTVDTMNLGFAFLTATLLV